MGNDTNNGELTCAPNESYHDGWSRSRTSCTPSVRGRLWSECQEVDRRLACEVVGPSRRIVVLVDWTYVNNTEAALVATIPMSGRAQIMYAQVHGQKRIGNRAVHRGFLELPAAGVAHGTADYRRHRRWIWSLMVRRCHRVWLALRRSLDEEQYPPSSRCGSSAPRSRPDCRSQDQAAIGGALHGHQRSSHRGDRRRSAHEKQESPSVEVQDTGSESELRAP